MNVVPRLRSVALSGDRPYLVAVALIFAVGALMLFGPVQRFLDGRERLEHLRDKHGALSAEIGQLERRVKDLNDPGQVELLAREELGLVKPGEVPYIVVTPEPERPQVAPARDTSPEPVPWYRRLWRATTGLLPG